MTNYRLPFKFLQRIPRSIGNRWRRSRAMTKVRRACLESHRPHGLPGELIVSLTSYPARFGTLHLTLRSLLAQSAKPDRLLVWVAHDDMPFVPQTVRALEQFGLEVRSCDDMRSFMKLVPTIDAFPDAFIATADDDIHYPREWLAALIDGACQVDPAIVSHRAHRPLRKACGARAPYRQWRFDVQDAGARATCSDIMPTGVGGVLYPPGSLHPMVTDRSAFERLCPHGDDLWFYWCARMAGTRFRKVGGRLRLIDWPTSQTSSLWAANKRGRNDDMIQALEAEFGIGLLTLGT